MQKKSVEFQKKIIFDSLLLGVIYAAALTSAYMLLADHGCRNLIYERSQYALTLLAAGQGRELAAVPQLQLVLGQDPVTRKIQAVRVAADMPKAQLEQATAFYENFLVSPVHYSVWADVAGRFRGWPGFGFLSGDNPDTYFFFEKPQGRPGLYRVLFKQHLLQFDMTEQWCKYLFPFVGLNLLFFGLLMLLFVFRVHGLYKKMKASLDEMESNLKEIFIGNFNVVFSTGRFALTQRVASIMNQMVFYFSQHSQEKENESQRDALTKLYTRKYLTAVFEKEIERTKRYGHPLSFLMIDIDHFKQCNDTYGHLMGDRVLQQTAQLIVDNCRESDTVARYGGEEIAVLLPETGLDEAEQVAEKLRSVVAEAKFIYSNTTISITISIGATSLIPEKQEIAPQIIKRADEGLYEAKEMGRNQVRRNMGSKKS